MFCHSYVINYSLLSLEDDNLNVKIYQTQQTEILRLVKRKYKFNNLINTYGNQLYSVDNNLNTTNKINEIV